MGTKKTDKAAKRTAQKGFLLVMMQPPPALEDEFNAWYDTEHIAERLAVPGFETAIRYVCTSGAPKYLAMYDLAAPEVLDSPAYHKVGYDNASPWTKRVTSRVRIYRSFGLQVHPGNAITVRSARVLVVRFRALTEKDEAVVIAGMRANFEQRPETLQVRVFRYETETGAGIDYLGMVESRAPLVEPIDVEAFGICGGAIDLVNTYATYT